jgi:hypothetical protein
MSASQIRRGQVLKQERDRVPQRRHSGTAWRVLTKLRVNLGLPISLPWPSSIMARLPAAAFGRLRAPVVITTIVHANADELQVSTTVEEKTGDASASGCRSATTPPTIASSVAKPQPAAVRRAASIAPPPSPPRQGLRWALATGTGPNGDCRWSTQWCVAVSVWSRLIGVYVSIRTLSHAPDGL